MRVVLGLSYNGSAYCGWQSQPSGCGVQDQLELAISHIAQHTVRVHVAGRTDAGVHAHAQVIHFDSETLRPMSAWVRGVNAHLPTDIRVIWSKVVDDDFHARFSAHARSYQYVLYNAPIASALMATKTGWFHLPLSIEKMQAASQYLLGEHDFSAFRAAECQAKSPIKTMYEVSVRKHGLNVIFEFSANAFVQHQVRNMVGALVYIGKGAHPPEFIQTLLAKKDRKLSPPTFSPKGLYLTQVTYDEKWELPSPKQDTLDFVQV